MQNIDYSKLDAKFVDITPEIASSFLEHNEKNRKLRNIWVKGLSKEIRNGNYKTTHQGIAFTKSGLLVDGQHRLQAIKECGITTKLLVTTGLDEDVFKVIDRGLKRTYSETTSLPIKCAESCRLAASLINGKSNVSSQDVLDIANTGFAEIHEELMNECGRNIRVFSSAPARLMAVLMIIDGHDKNHVFVVYRDLVLANFDSNFNIVKSILQKAALGKFRSGQGYVYQRDLLTIFKKAYDFGYKDSNLRINESDSSTSIQYVKDVLRKVM